jgi:FKBP-type peptidyl-prolyl cis-trans isomerase
MKRTLCLATALLALVATSAFAAGPALETDDQRTVYALGLNIALTLKNYALSPAEMELVKQGIADGMAGKVQADDKGPIDALAYRPKIQQLGASRAAVVAEGEKKDAQVFLDAQAKEKGAEKTASGLVYIPIKAGTGETPKATDTVKVHYQGTLRDGTVFDSSIERGQPATFPLNRVIPCWTEGVQKMKVGGKAKLVCPSAIAYGDRGAPPKIKPGAALVFEVELLGIEAPAAPATPAAPAAAPPPSHAPKK